MNGLLLRCYLHEDQSHGLGLAWESLIEHAMKSGISGGSAFRAMAGFGRHHVMHEGAHFFTKATQTIQVEFLVTEDQARDLLQWATTEGITAFYARIPARFDMVGETTATPPNEVTGSPPVANPGD